MPILTQGQTATLAMVKADSVTIESGQSMVSIEYPVGTKIFEGRGARTFGPFTGGSLKITATAGTCEYEYADGSDPVAAITGTPSDQAAFQALVSGAGISGQAYILKSFTGRSQLTGGTAGVKTALMEVPIPDGWLSRLDVRMDIELAINYTNNADNKEWGVALGAGSAFGGTVAASVDLRQLTGTTTASITDKIVVQRSAETPTRLYLALPNNARSFGTNAGAGATIGALASASIDPDATGRSLWVWARNPVNTANQISLEHLFVQMQRGAA